MRVAVTEQPAHPTQHRTVHSPNAKNMRTTWQPHRPGRKQHTQRTDLDKVAHIFALVLLEFSHLGHFVTIGLEQVLGPSDFLVVIVIMLFHLAAGVLTVQLLEALYDPLHKFISIQFLITVTVHTVDQHTKPSFRLFWRKFLKLLSTFM